MYRKQIGADRFTATIANSNYKLLAVEDMTNQSGSLRFLTKGGQGAYLFITKIYILPALPLQVADVIQE